MTPDEARAHYNFLLTLCIRKAETFGPLAFAFIKDHNLNTLGLTPEEQFNLSSRPLKPLPTSQSATRTNWTASRKRSTSCRAQVFSTPSWHDRFNRTSSG